MHKITKRPQNHVRRHHVKTSRDEGEDGRSRICSQISSRMPSVRGASLASMSSCRVADLRPGEFASLHNHMKPHNCRRRCQPCTASKTYLARHSFLYSWYCSTFLSCCDLLNSRYCSCIAAFSFTCTDECVKMCPDKVQSTFHVSDWAHKTGSHTTAFAALTHSSRMAVSLKAKSRTVWATSLIRISI